jgi:hypothetical protein
MNVNNYKTISKQLEFLYVVALELIPSPPGSTNHSAQHECIHDALTKKGDAMNKLEKLKCTPMNEGGRTRKSNRKQSRKSNRKQSRKSNRKHKTRVKNL